VNGRSPGVRVAACLFLVAGLAPRVVAAAADQDRLVFHAETASGEAVASQLADLPFNPASVVKVATSLWALESLGPDHRYSTVVGTTGSWDRAAGRIAGDLVVIGGGDPDFHNENAMLAARELNRIGVRKVDGDLLVVPPFWLGWENGSEEPRDPVQRNLDMAYRLLRSFERGRWKAPQLRAWRAMCARRGWQDEPEPAIVIRGGVRVVEAAEVADAVPLVVHRSNPLHVILRRFNVYSNNDIIRVADGLGGAEALASFLRVRLGAGRELLDLTTASGQLSNRITARLAVGLTREFLAVAERAGLRPEELLPVAGCDPGPISDVFPHLVAGPQERTILGKTGTLITTDGGVVAFAGTFNSRDRGPILFCVAAPRSGWQAPRWRRAEESWLLDLMASTGGAEERACGPLLPHPDTMAEVAAPRAPG
jgi:D-alanyl-D-alanine carboxypeptidase/D-alanyl-D-alanine-endopeptidase (penicillin-binding protein 4)